MEFNLCKITQNFWRDYFLSSAEINMTELLNGCDANAVIIGSEQDEFYTSLEEAHRYLLQLSHIKEDCSLQISNEWYECRRISPDIFLVYGSLSVKGQNTESITNVRFSILYKITEDSYKIMHIHQSMPMKNPVFD